MQNQDTALESTKKNIIGLSERDSNKLSRAAFSLISVCLEKLSLAKNIQLMDGTLTVWEKLVVEDLKAKNFEIEDFVNAINDGIRTPMYNRIDYSDIYTFAEDSYSRRRKCNEIVRGNKPPSTARMPQHMKDTITNLRKGGIVPDIQGASNENEGVTS